jgi:hypothetical protein
MGFARSLISNRSVESRFSFTGFNLNGGKLGPSERTHVSTYHVTLGLQPRIKPHE